LREDVSIERKEKYEPFHSRVAYPSNDANWATVSKTFSLVFLAAFQFLNKEKTRLEINRPLVGCTLILKKRKPRNRLRSCLNRPVLGAQPKGVFSIDGFPFIRNAKRLAFSPSFWKETGMNTS
jgi:hypothetical protein